MRPSADKHDSQDQRPARSRSRLRDLLYWPVLRRPRSTWDSASALRDRQRDIAPAVTELRAERQHPLVTHHLRASETKRLLLGAALVCSALFPGLTALLLSDGSLRSYMFYYSHLLACLWPLFACLGAAISTASAVLAERQRDTAFQLALTPLGKTTIAAASVLPGYRPWILAVIAAVPAYVVAASSYTFWTPLTFWPLRLLLLPADAHPGKLHVIGLAVAMLMCFTDCWLVWVAAHWGAAYAVRFGGLINVGLHMLFRFVLWGLSLIACFLFATVPLAIGAAATVLVTEFFQQEDIGNPTIVAAVSGVVILGLAAVASFTVLVLTYRRMMLCPGVAAVMSEFARFDRLADPDFVPGRHPATDPWTLWWDDSARL